MNIRTPLTALAFCLASTVTFAATPATPTTKSGTSATTHQPSGTHCATNQVMEHGKCVAKDKAKSKN